MAGEKTAGVEVCGVELLRRSLTGLLGVRGLRWVVSVFGVVVGILGVVGAGLRGGTTHEEIVSRIGCVSLGPTVFVLVLNVITIPDFLRERSVVDREVRNEYYHPVLYHAVTIVASVFRTVVLAAVTTGVLGAFGTVRLSWEYFGITALTLFCGDSVGILVSHLLTDEAVALGVVFLFNGISALLQGSVVLPSRMSKPVLWLTNVAFQTRSFRLFMINEFSSSKSATTNLQSHQYPTGQSVLDNYSIDSESKNCLLYYAVGIHLLSFLVLQYQYFMFINGNVIQPQDKGKEEITKEEVILELI